MTVVMALTKNGHPYVARDLKTVWEQFTFDQLYNPKEKQEKQGKKQSGEENEKRRDKS